MSLGLVGSADDGCIRTPGGQRQAGFLYVLLMCARAFEKFASPSESPRHTNTQAFISASPATSHFKHTGKPHGLLASFVVQVSQLSSELDSRQEEVVSLQRSLTAAQQEKDTVEQTLASLVRFFMLLRRPCHCAEIRQSAVVMDEWSTGLT